jgi:hypothetical protein
VELVPGMSLSAGGVAEVRKWWRPKKKPVETTEEWRKGIRQDVLALLDGMAGLPGEYDIVEVTDEKLIDKLNKQVDREKEN